MMPTEVNNHMLAATSQQLRDSFFFHLGETDCAVLVQPAEVEIFVAVCYCDDIGIWPAVDMSFTGCCVLLARY